MKLFHPTLVSLREPSFCHLSPWHLPMAENGERRAEKESVLEEGGFSGFGRINTQIEMSPSDSPRSVALALPVTRSDLLTSPSPPPPPPFTPSPPPPPFTPSLPPHTHIHTHPHSPPCPPLQCSAQEHIMVIRQCVCIGINQRESHRKELRHGKVCL